MADTDGKNGLSDGQEPAPKHPSSSDPSLTDAQFVDLVYDAASDQGSPELESYRSVLSTFRTYVQEEPPARDLVAQALEEAERGPRPWIEPVRTWWSSVSANPWALATGLSAACALGLFLSATEVPFTTSGEVAPETRSARPKSPEDKFVQTGAPKPGIAESDEDMQGKPASRILAPPPEEASDQPAKLASSRSDRSQPSRSTMKSRRRARLGSGPSARSTAPSGGTPLRSSPARPMASSSGALSSRAPAASPPSEPEARQAMAERVVRSEPAAGGMMEAASVSKSGGGFAPAAARAHRAIIRGLWTEAEQHLHDAETLARTVAEQGQVYLLWARLELGRGRPRAAERHAKRAAQLKDFSGAAEARALLRSIQTSADTASPP